jgi:hypothetical protein
MPRKLESGGTYSYVLKTDRDKQPPPTFKLRILSGREDDKLREIVLAGWENMGGLSFTLDEAENLLTRRECWELIGDATLEASLTPEERKKLESPPSSETG